MTTEEKQKIYVVVDRDRLAITNTAAIFRSAAIDKAVRFLNATWPVLFRLGYRVAEVEFVPVVCADQREGADI